LTADLWTPNLDASGKILASDFEKLPLNRWVAASTNKLDDVVPTPRYPTYLGHPDGSRSIIDAWCGAAWNYVDQKMYFSGGGHADSHFCENGIYELEADTLRFSMAMPRAPMSAAQYWDPASQNFVSGTNGSGGGPPLRDGSVPASHTYDSLIWIPSNVVGNQRGAILMFHYGIGVVDLDTRTYDTALFDHTATYDLSYKMNEMDGWNMIYARANFYYRRWDMRPTARSVSRWSNNSRGTDLGYFDAGANIVYNHKMMVRMPHRREFVVLSGTANTRCRYGQAFDSNNRNSWRTYHDTITLTSSDGSHLDFANRGLWTDTGTGGSLFAAGGTYDHWGNCIWVQSNHQGGTLYKITGLNSNSWTVSRVTGAAALTASKNGTYHRCQVIYKGAATCLLRASSTIGWPEVCRVA
jgi:hypothetical protein